MTRCRCRAAMAAGLLAMGADDAAQAQAPAEAQVPAQAPQLSQDEGPSLEFRTNVPWARMTLSGKQSVRGRSPLRIPGPLTGRFWLEAGGPGVEFQRGRVSISLDENGSRVFSYGGAPARQALMRSVVFPGLSQLRTRQVPKGVLMTVLGAGGIGLSVWAHDDLRGLEDDVESLERQVAAAPDSTRETLQESLRDARAEAAHRKDGRDVFLGATGALWGISLIDALIFTPRLAVSDADGSSVAISLRRKTRGRALARSLIFPGLGQAYNGNGKKGAWVGAGGILAVSYLVYRQDDVARARAYLTQAEARLAAGGTAEDVERRDGRLRQLDDAEGERNTAGWIIAGYWALSLLDTGASFEEPWGDVPVGGTASGGLGWRVDPVGGSLAAQLRF